MFFCSIVLSRCLILLVERISVTDIKLPGGIFGFSVFASGVLATGYNYTSMVVEARKSPGPSIAERIGSKQITFIAWEATPLPWKLIAPIYSKRILQELLESSRNLDDLWISHSRLLDTSVLYRLARARYRIVQDKLTRLGIE